MEIDIYQQGDVKVVALNGDLDSTTAGDAYERIQQQLGPQDRVLFNMTDVSYMSSAGIRTLLLLYRVVHENNGKVVLVGLSEELRETLDITGFLEYFNVRDNLDAGLKALS